MEGIARIARIYAQWAALAEDRGNLGRAQRYLRKALTLAPDDPALEAELRRLEVASTPADG
jgi:Flp pilus assembly protein TadD